MVIAQTSVTMHMGRSLAGGLWTQGQVFGMLQGVHFVSPSTVCHCR